MALETCADTGLSGSSGRLSSSSRHTLAPWNERHRSEAAAGLGRARPAPGPCHSPVKRNNGLLGTALAPSGFHCGALRASHRGPPGPRAHPLLCHCARFPSGVRGSETPTSGGGSPEDTVGHASSPAEPASSPILGRLRGDAGRPEAPMTGAPGKPFSPQLIPLLLSDSLSTDKPAIWVGPGGLRDHGSQLPRAAPLGPRRIASAAAVGSGVWVALLRRQTVGCGGKGLVSQES